MTYIDSRIAPQFIPPQVGGMTFHGKKPSARQVATGQSSNGPWQTSSVGKQLRAANTPSATARPQSLSQVLPSKSSMRAASGEQGPPKSLMYDTAQASATEPPASAQFDYKNPAIAQGPPSSLSDQFSRPVLVQHDALRKLRQRIPDGAVDRGNISGDNADPLDTESRQQIASARSLFKARPVDHGNITGDNNDPLDDATRRQLSAIPRGTGRTTARNNLPDPVSHKPSRLAMRPEESVSQLLSKNPQLRSLFLSMMR